MGQLTQKVIGCALTVGSTLRCGFLEKVYFGKPKLEVRRVANNY